MRRFFITSITILLASSAISQIRINGKDVNPLYKLIAAEDSIANLYVEPVDENKLVEDGIRGMLEKLDPHSSYTTAKETKALT